MTDDGDAEDSPPFPVVHLSCTSVTLRGRQDAFHNHFNFLADQGPLWGQPDVFVCLFVLGI